MVYVRLGQVVLKHRYFLGHHTASHYGHARPLSVIKGQLDLPRDAQRAANL